MRRIGSGRSGEQGAEDRENRGRENRGEMRRIGSGRSGEQGAGRVQEAKEGRVGSGRDRGKL